MGDGETLVEGEDKATKPEDGSTLWGGEAAPPQDGSSGGEGQSSPTPPEAVDDWSDSLAGIGALADKTMREKLNEMNGKRTSGDLYTPDVIALSGNQEATMAIKDELRKRINSLFPDARPELLDEMLQAADAKLEAEGKARVAQAEEDREQKQKDADAAAQAFTLGIKNSDKPLDDILRDASKSTELSEPTEPLAPPETVQ